jgi:hypothetical protein
VAKKSRKKDKIFMFTCAFCAGMFHHRQFATCEQVQTHIREFPPRKRNPHVVGKCDVCYEKDVLASLPLKGWWTSIKKFFTFGR